MTSLLIATHNPGKLREIRALLAEVPVEVVDPGQLGIRLDIDEDGETFLANARIKAEAGLRLSGVATLADDSGLEVPALDGRPGVHSARFAGPGASSGDLINALLRELGPRAQQSPTAFFHCTAVLQLPGGKSFVGEGVLEGTIAARPRGTHGFGFDPIFKLPDGRHLAELSLEDKNLLSHRARAIAALEVHGAFDALVRYSPSPIGGEGRGHSPSPLGGEGRGGGA